MSYLTTQEAAKELGISRMRVWNLVTTGKLQAERLGPLWIISRVTLDEFKTRKRPTGRPISKRTN